MLLVRLVGRDAELERGSRALLDDVRGGGARSLLVVGEAGIGSRRPRHLDQRQGRLAPLQDPPAN